MCGSRDSSCLMSVYWIWRLYTLLFPFIYITRSSVELCYDLHVCGRWLRDYIQIRTTMNGTYQRGAISLVPEPEMS